MQTMQNSKRQTDGWLGGEKSGTQPVQGRGSCSWTFKTNVFVYFVVTKWLWLNHVLNKHWSLNMKIQFSFIAFKKLPRESHMMQSEDIDILSTKV